MNKDTFRKMTTKTQVERYVEIVDEIKKGGYPLMCGFGLYEDQIEEIRCLLLPFTPKKKEYFDIVIRTRLIPG